ncbi:Fe-S cluster assembly protein SufD [Candidatus Woesearchaeota archaeon]|nr:Fe-S cluster assembly protein SufD [Candidatus Woesearchaeota archaeon]
MTATLLSHEPDWLITHRKKSLDAFTALPAPLFKYGIGIFVDTSMHDFSRLRTDAPEELAISAPCEVVVTPLAQAIKENPGYFRAFLSNVPQDKFLTLHHAFFNSGVVLRIPAHTTVSQPIMITGDLDRPLIDFVFVIAEPNSTATIIDCAQSSVYSSHVVHISAQDKSRVTYVTHQNNDERTLVHSRKEADVSSDAHVTWIDSTLGTRFTHSTTLTRLNQQGAESHTHGLFLGTGQHVFDINTQTLHNAPKTTSTMTTRGALSGNAKAVYRGLVRIEQHARGSNGHQKEDTLLLSKNAEADAVPYLEINTNDVTCSHGATIGRVNNEQLFYLMSRGVTEADAKRAIIEGFFEPIINHITHSPHQDAIRNTISRQTL